ncbi:DUF2189 domain-containing protein [Rubrivivax albus]|uniref:DUF2189 domain-containing protein n=1 Tax=Rubrivivax albus TaxID=2499835 RepID=A0A437JNM7_9BURK|nr:DUF2189 domain-containing protein [Rubrivivax albus]RVT48467.1 DUF2189 domain-containing protein [Rubrivivax albus]
MQRSPAVEASRRFRPRTIPLSQPLRWLERGAVDFTRNPGPGLLHGLLAALFGGVLFVLAGQHFWLVAGAFSGFLIVAPLAATGLYAVSRAMERGEPAGFRAALAVWHPRNLRLVGFGVLLALAGTGWVMTSGALIIGFAPAPVLGPKDFLQVVLLGDGWLFEVWLMLGAILAAPVFASSVVAIPMLLDRDEALPVAIYTSWRVVMEDPVPLALWAGIIMALTALGMATALTGLIVILPWLAHASWHAYRDLVELPPEG